MPDFRPSPFTRSLCAVKFVEFMLMYDKHTAGAHHTAHWSKGYPKNQTPFCIIFVGSCYSKPFFEYQDPAKIFSL